MVSNPADNNGIEQQLEAFLQHIDALMLATVNGEGLPEASYAPYVEHDGCYYIFVSGLASHTTNLKQSGVAGVIFMDSKDDGQAHSRKRLSCHCDSTVIERSDVLFESVMQQMEEQFGKLIATLRGLNDFQLFKLNPVKGNFVTGFGKAFAIDFPPGGGIRHRRAD